MKKRTLLRAVLSLTLCVSLVTSLCGTALAAFRDVTEDSPWKEAVAVLEEKGTTLGTDPDSFSPEKAVTTAQLCVFLGRIAGVSPDRFEVPEGVCADGWSATYVAWALANGLLSADGPAQYQQLTVQQANAILSAFCAFLGVEPLSFTASGAYLTRGEAAVTLAKLAQADFLHCTDAAYTTVTTGEDWGPAIGKVIVDFGVELKDGSVKPESFSATSVRAYPELDYMTYEVSDPIAHVEERNITAAYICDENGNPAKSGSRVALEMEIAPWLESGSPFAFDMLSYQNYYVDTSYEIALNVPLTTASGLPLSMEPTNAAGYADSITLLADDFDTTGTYTYTYGEKGERGIDLTYASWLPKEHAAKGSTPLIVWLHGAGEGGTDPYVTILGNKVVNLITDEVQKNFGFTGAAVLAPQCPTMWLDTSGVSTGSASLDNVSGESFYTEALMSLIVDYLKDHPEIDSKRVYVGGCSNGGFMTVNLLVTYPGAFAAAFPVCEPYANDWMTEEKLQTLVDVPMWLTASKSDTIVTLYEGYWDEEYPYYYHVTTDENGQEAPVYEYSNALYDRLVKAGAKNVHYSLFDNVVDTTGLYKYEDGTPYEYDGHWSWIYTLNNECVDTINGKEVTIFQWMAQQKGEGKFPTQSLEKTVYPKINFYLTRHGQTEYNVQGVAQGWCDSPLTQKGIDLAKQLNKGLADVPFVAAYSSDSGRAVDTAKYALAGRDIDVTQTELLREMCYGEMEGKPNSELITEENFDYRFMVGFDDVGGETWDELGSRMVRAMELAALEHREEGGNIFISTHGMSILGALYYTVPYADGVMEQEQIDNCSVTILEWDNGVYTLKALNDTSYLK